MASGWTSYLVKDTEGETIMIADGPKDDERFMQMLRMQLRMVKGDVEFTLEEVAPPPAEAAPAEVATGGSAAT